MPGRTSLPAAGRASPPSPRGRTRPRRPSDPEAPAVTRRASAARTGGSPRGRRGLGRRRSRPPPPRAGCPPRSRTRDRSPRTTSSPFDLTSRNGNSTAAGWISISVPAGLVTRWISSRAWTMPSGSIQQSDQDSSVTSKTSASLAAAKSSKATCRNSIRCVRRLREPRVRPGDRVLERTESPRRGRLDRCTIRPRRLVAEPDLQELAFSSL